MTPRALSFFPFLMALLALLMGASPALSATNETVLHSFQPYLHGYPVSMVGDSAGNFYGASGGGSYSSGLIYKVTPKAQGGWAETILYNFTGGNDGGNPVSLYWDGSDFYGLTESGGKFSSGVFFELTPRANGTWSEHVLFDFPNENAGLINSGLARDAAGNFYATTFSWFGPVYGSLFQLTRTTGGAWTEVVVHNFTNGSDGGTPYCTPLLDAAGNIYGTTEGGGTNKLGVIFEFSPSGKASWNETVLYNFADITDGYYAESLVFDQAGDLLGTTQNGGAPKCTPSGGCGTVFELKPDSNGIWTKTTLHTFGQLNDDNYSAGLSNLVTDDLGNIYGAVATGGSQNCSAGCGFVFELSPQGEQWSFSAIFGFTGGTKGFAPGGIFLSVGEIYGSFERDIPGEQGSFFRLSSNGDKWTLTSLLDFLTTDAASPLSNLIQDASGNLYGTADFSGTYNIGAVYELTPNGSGGWKESVIYNFASGFDNFVNGVDPSGLTMDAAGNLYGAAGFSGPAEYGSVFELSPLPGGKWQEKDLVDFAGGLDQPLGGVVFDRAGNLYGTTSRGGSNGLGAIFELIPGANGQWTEKPIHSFVGYPSDGASPVAGLIMDQAGNFYGTTQKGGNSANCTGGGGQAIGCGTVFKLSLTVGGSWQVQVLYSFKGSTIDGASPVAPLILDSAGNLYGTTQQGGIKAGCSQETGLPTCGTIFELSPNGSAWMESILYEFTNSAGDGAIPVAAVTLDRTGNLWGTTASGGTFGDGTVFELTPEAGGGWGETVVHSFGTGAYDGKYPEGSLLLDMGGNLYGATAAGGQAWNGNRGWASAGYGTVFEITP
jgi:uncharacterized repeat protein (TIGR03803 family)